MNVCKVCAAPGVLYQRDGKQHQRYHCAEHWTAYCADKRREYVQRLGVPEGWKATRNHWLKPPQGMTRVVLDGYRNRVTVYRGNAWRTTHWRTLKRMNSLPKLREFYTAIGYQATADKRRWCVLERTQP